MIGKNVKKRLRLQTRMNTCGRTNTCTIKKRYVWIEYFLTREKLCNSKIKRVRFHVSVVKRSAKTQLFQTRLPEWIFLQCDYSNRATWNKVNQSQSKLRTMESDLFG